MLRSLVDVIAPVPFRLPAGMPATTTPSVTGNWLKMTGDAMLTVPVEGRPLSNFFVHEPIGMHTPGIVRPPPPAGGAVPPPGAGIPGMPGIPGKPVGIPPA